MMKIEERLTELRLHGMHNQWVGLKESPVCVSLRTGRRDAQNLSLTEGMKILLQAEAEEREHRRKNRLTTQARFRYQASVEEITYTPERNLDKNTIHILASNQYIQHGEAVLITGATGCGKSYIASALGHHACAHGFKTDYFNMQKLIKNLKMARIDGSAVKFFDKLSKTHLLIIDDFGLSVLEAQSRLSLLEIIEDRHRKHATIIAGQLPVVQWYDIIGEDTIADAIMDRLTTKAHKLELKGKSMRKSM